MAKITYLFADFGFANLVFRVSSGELVDPNTLVLTVEEPLEGSDGYGQIVLEGNFQTSGGRITGGTIHEMTFFAGDESDQRLSLKIENLSLDVGSLFNALGQTDPELRYEKVLDLVYGGNDDIDAGSDDYLIVSGDSSDYIRAGYGDDSVDAGEGDDHVLGFYGDDIVLGGVGLDTLYGQDGADVLDGGEDYDRLDGGAGNDFVIGGLGADKIQGGKGADLIDAGGDDDRVHGGVGNDLIMPGAGSDTVDGGAQTLFARGTAEPGSLHPVNAVGDLVTYEQETARVDIDLERGSAIEADGSIDTLIDIEGVIGGVRNDLLRGDGGNNLFVTGAGSDLVDGRGGFDVVDYSYGAAEGGVVVDLGRGRATEAAGGRDRLSNVEGVFGSFGDDRILGDDGDNILGGVAGADVLTGRGGADDFVFSFGLETGVGLDLIKDFASGEDTLVFDKSAYGLGDRINVFVGSEPVARGRADVFLLDVDTGVLSLDLDGAGAGGAVEIATLKGVTSLTAEDFALI